MTVIAEPLAPAIPVPRESRQPEQRVVLYNVSWQDYEKIGDTLRDRPALRLTYDQGTLEIMVTSSRHEVLKRRLARLIEALAEELDLPMVAGGNTTWRREDMLRGLEADDCFWIANEEKVRGKLDLDLAVDPPPDLGLEIEISRSATDRMGIYAALGIPEVWRFDEETLRVFLLQPDRTYRQAERSPTFPQIPLDGIVPFIFPRETMDDLTLVRQFRAWVREQIQAAGS